MKKSPILSILMALVFSLASLGLCVSSLIAQGGDVPKCSCRRAEPGSSPTGMGGS